MNEKEILKVVMKERKVTQEQLAKKLGYAAQAGVGRLLSRDGSLRVDTLVKLLSALDYDVVIRDRWGRAEYAVDTDDDSIEEMEARVAAIQRRIKEIKERK